MLSPENTIYPLQSLVDQCWGMLKGTVRVTFPTTTPARPSRYARTEPQGISYVGAFWEAVAVPTLRELLDHPPTYEGGWWNPMARSLVEAYLRRTLNTSPWSGWVDLTR
jgi:hypothetical protein